MGCLSRSDANPLPSPFPARLKAMLPGASPLHTRSHAADHTQAEPRGPNKSVSLSPWAWLVAASLAVRPAAGAWGKARWPISAPRMSRAGGDRKRGLAPKAGISSDDPGGTSPTMTRNEPRPLTDLRIGAIPACFSL